MKIDCARTREIIRDRERCMHIANNAIAIRVDRNVHLLIIADRIITITVSDAAFTSYERITCDLTDTIFREMKNENPCCLISVIIFFFFIFDFVQMSELNYFLTSLVVVEKNFFV